MRTKLPLLRGFVRNGQIHVWCPFCQRFHDHGWGDGDRRPSHRVAHCDSESGFYSSGYFIAPFTKKDLKELLVEQP